MGVQVPCGAPQAASDKKRFPKTRLALEVVEFLESQLTESLHPDISFRTLKKGYILAEAHPGSWKELFADTLPKGPVNREILIRELSRKNLKVKEQARLFEQSTGLKTRSFYNYRKELKINRDFE